MRNWNLAFFTSSLFLNICFYSTYEELKQAPFRPESVSPYSFYSTYEELKLLYGFFFPA